MIYNKTFFSKTLKIYAMIFMVSVFFALSSSSAHSSPCKTGECQYYRAEKNYKTFQKDLQAQKRRDKWMDIIEDYRKVEEIEPNGPFAAVGLYKTGTMYMGLFNVSKNRKDQDSAREYFEKASRFKKSRVRFEAEQLLKSLPSPPPSQTKTAPPQPAVKGTVAKQAPVKKEEPGRVVQKRDVTAPVPVKKPSAGVVPVKGLRFGSLPTRTRIVIDTESQVTFKHGVLSRGDKGAPVKQLYVDLKNSSLYGAAQSELTIEDERVKSLKAVEETQNTVRLLIETSTFKDYKVFALKSPSRVVIDVWGHSYTGEEDNNAGPAKGSVADASDLARQLQLGVKRVVIDPGHGGQDAGAPGFVKGVHEKDVVLSISKALAEKMEKELGVEVILTRSDDTFITLDERAQIANRKKADLFISIHTNASLNKQAYGIETYFLNLTQDKDSVAVAARENATSEKSISDLQSILDSLMKNTKITESSKLATYVQEAMVRNLSRSYDQINSKGVKQAPFYVLIGAQMPAILVETSFISNERECKRLTDAAYQEKICEAIIDGVKAYMHKTGPVKK